MSQLTIELLRRQNDKPTMFEKKKQEILPCPFCGSDEIVFGYDDDLLNDCKATWLSCFSCGVEGPVRDSRLNAISAWQKRKI